jgi:hypothetical protein
MNKISLSFLFMFICQTVISDEIKLLGSLKNNLFEGYAKQTWMNGNVYEGDYQNDMFNGEGTYITTDGKEYKSFF